MASTVFVLDSSFKRTQIKVSPGTALREVLEEACRSRKLTPEAYALKTQNNKLIDLSQPFRLSGLSAGAKLQLVQASRSPTVVSLALQLPESEGGGRLSDKFTSTTSLWVMLRKFEDGMAGPARRINLTQRGAPTAASGSGRLLYEQPCINVMGRSLETFQDLQKTLAQVGLGSGSALLRLSFKLTEKPLEEAMQEMSEFFVAAEPEDKAATITPQTKETSITNGAPAEVAAPTLPPASSDTNGLIPASSEDHAIQSQSAPSLVDTALEPATTTSSNNVVNGISVYSAPTSSTPAAALQPTDEAVFEPSVDHAKAHQAALNRASRNTRLLSDKELEEQERQKQDQLASVRSIVVRVRFPDQLMIESTATSSESAAQLYAKVRQTITFGEEPFELRFIGAKGQQIIPDSEQLLLVRDLGFRGRILVNFAWLANASLNARQQPSLKEEYRAHAVELKVELAAQRAESEIQQKKEEKVEEKKKAGSKVDMEAKLKKFMGFGKK